MFPGPSGSDLRDVAAINLRYLRHCRRQPAGGADGPVAGIRELGDAALLRLAGVPFLLVSLREHDAGFWSAVLGAEHSADLFEVREAGADATAVGIAAIAFLWQLCRRDLHTARLVAGAPIEWCEGLLTCPLIELIDRCSMRPGLLVPRLGDDGAFWQRLLTAGVAGDPDLRRAAQLAALHQVLARQASDAPARLAAAACHLAPAPTRRSR
ncbi:MAG: hypothetical protein R3176_04055 [Woeseiaceae bacterium]|nr:hypothetical protein [Woeseiaceae bacterium]